MLLILFIGGFMKKELPHPVDFINKIEDARLKVLIKPKAQKPKAQKPEPQRLTKDDQFPVEKQLNNQLKQSGDDEVYESEDDDELGWELNHARVSHHSQRDSDQKKKAELGFNTTGSSGYLLPFKIDDTYNEGCSVPPSISCDISAKSYDKKALSGDDKENRDSFNQAMNVPVSPPNLRVQLNVIKTIR